MMPPRPTEAVACDHGHRRQAIVQSLLMDVFEGRVRPGQHLVTRGLAARFGVSDTPIREAIIALEAVGVVDVTPNRGAVVRRIGLAEVAEICQVRRALECEATRGACGQIAPATLRALAAEFRKLRQGSSTPSAEFLDRARAADSRLHDLIAASCRNDFLRKELGRLTILFRAFRDVTYSRGESRFSSGRFEAETDEHLTIVESLLKEDRKAAVRAMSRHIRKSVENWTGTPPDAPPEPSPLPDRGPATRQTDGRPRPVAR